MINKILVFLIQNQEPVSTSAERNLLIYMVSVLLILCGLIIVFFVLFQKRKNKLLLDKIKQQQAFEDELANTQIEIQEQTLKNIGQELHDNIGQLLSVANMQLSILNSQVPKEIQESFTETKNVVKESLGEVRSLSKSLNSEVIVNRGFKKSIKNEIDRLNKLQLIKATMLIEGDESYFSESKDSIILFRIIQEFFSNTLKYGNAKLLLVKLNYQKRFLEITLSDDGEGFDVEKVEKGSGLINMKSRSVLIGVDYTLTSIKEKGTKLKLRYTYRAEPKLKI